LARGKRAALRTAGLMVIAILLGAFLALGWAFDVELSWSRTAR
jgi:hypothetical protein